MNTLHFTIAIGMMSTPIWANALQARPQNQNPHLQPDETWISISGEFDRVRSDAFTLRYQDGFAGTIKIEMDDWDWHDEASPLKADQKVTVYGEIDDDLYETRTIEAGSVYVQNLGTYFYASSADDESGDYGYWIDYEPIDIDRTHVRGTVKSVNGREFTVDSSLGELIVDTDELAYNPMDDTGYHQIDVGDYVSISGHIDDDLFEARELKAEYIVTLRDYGRD